MPRIILSVFALIFAFQFQLLAQNQEAVIYGSVVDSTGKKLGDVNISIAQLKKGTVTDKDGYYEISVPSGISLTLRFSYLKVFTKTQNLPPLAAGSRYRLNITMKSQVQLAPVDIKEKGSQNTTLQKIDPKSVSLNPSPGGGVEAVLKTLPGVHSNSELSSSYSVRGGNYDENLVYINDVEVYRPFLVRSGQQEGLSIINPDLVGSIEFSAGGFEAQFGDKLSSVLNITYKEPTEFGGSFSASLLGGTAHIEGSSKNHRFTYLAGARYRSNKYILNTLDVKGDFNPVYGDLQSYLTYDINSDLEIGWLSSLSANRFELVPQDRETKFGTFNQVIRLRIYFEGKEEMRYNTLLNAVTLKYKASPKTNLKFIASEYSTEEQEEFDILGEYWLDELDNDPSSETFNKAKLNLGIGTFLNHARNDFSALIYNFQHKGETQWGHDSRFRWGVKFQHEDIDDKLREWRMLDSAGYSLPYDTNKELQLDRFESSKISLSSNRLMGYVQNTFTLSADNGAFLTVGVRGNYWDFNNEFLLSPRVQFVIEPNQSFNRRMILNGEPESSLKRSYKIKLAAGIYDQPPFYREFRDRDGNINKNIKAQKSYHFVASNEMMIKLFSRPFKWTTEAYYKYIYDLIPYDIEDVRIRYFAKNNAVGYAAGVDFQLYGEFVKGLPSWASLSLLTTKEKIDGDQYQLVNKETGDTTTVDPGYIRRPTDQRVNFSIYFQDFLKNNPNYKVFLNYQFGTNLPFGPPESKRFRNQLKIDPYQRVDVGFSRLISFNETKEESFFSNLDAVWISLEVFNLFNVQNTISHFWVKDIQNNDWPVPNYLTGRRFNLKVRVEF